MARGARGNDAHSAQPRDYEALGLRVGLEIHQQLAAGHKLFCACPIKKSEEFPLRIERKLRAVPSELGEFDPAAVYEYLRNKSFVYHINSESSCLVEQDEEPPHPVNKEALRIALQIAKLLRADVVDEIHVMRKTVIDGSAVSGFQRTALIAANGEVDTPSGALAIKTIMLEEDSATPVAQRGDVVEYRLDRLGIPLVEIATSSDIHTPQHAKEAAAAIGRLLRSASVVRGIGSIRQDINISIRDGARIEIKGFQELEKIPAVVANEVERQVALLEIREELERRGADKPEEIRRGAAFADATKLFAGTKNNFIRSAVREGARVTAIKLPRFGSLLAFHKGTFGKELSSYAEAYGFGIMHSDEDVEKQGTGAEFRELRKTLNAGEQDALLIVAGAGAEKAVAALIERAAACAAGVPEETRVADGEGSKYTRPLPGAGRLYPESDIPAIITKQLLAGIEVPETLDERKKALGLSEELAEQIINSPYVALYEKLKKHGPALVAAALLQLTALRREGVAVENVSESAMEKIFAAASDGKVPRDAVLDIIRSAAAGQSVEALITARKALSDAELLKIVRAAVAANPGRKESVLMGIVMAKAAGRASGERVVKLLRKEMR